MELLWLPSATSVLQPLEQVVTAFVAPPVATPETSFDAVPGVPRAPGDDTICCLNECYISSCLLYHSPILLTTSHVSGFKYILYTQNLISDTIFWKSCPCWPMEGKEGLLWWHATSIYQLSMLHLLHLGKLARWRWDWFLSWPLHEGHAMWYDSRGNTGTSTGKICRKSVNTLVTQLKADKYEMKFDNINGQWIQQL